MAAKTFKFRGKAYWAKVGIQGDDPDEYGGKEFYKVTVALDDDSLVKFKRSELRLQIKENDDEEQCVTFRRDAVAKTGTDKKGRPWSLGGGAPKVVDEDDEPLDEYIGNGSEIEVTVERYPSKIGKWGHRLEKVKVLELVKYERPEYDDEEEEEKEESKPTKTETSAPNKTRIKKDLPF